MAQYRVMYYDDGVEVLDSIKLDQNRQFTFQASLGEPAGGFHSPLYKRFNLSGVPDNFLLDRTGKIVARDLHGADLERTLRELISRDEN